MKKTSSSQARTKVLPNKRNKQSLIPVRSHHQDHPKVCMPGNNGASFFKNSGPSIDRVSPPTLPETGKRSSSVLKPAISSQSGIPKNSVLTQYIDRFRYGQPLSREERQQISSGSEEERMPLWWMSSSSLPPCSTPTKSSHKDDHSQAISTPARRQLDNDFNSSPCRGEYNKNANILSDTSQCEFEDTEIFHLQERASRLLQDHIPSNGLIAVRSGGLGSSNWSSPVNINERSQGCLTNESIKSKAGMTKLDSAPAVPLQRHTSFITPPPHPEQDILTQWRLRRKMEQVNEWCKAQENSRLFTPTFSSLGPSLHTSPVHGQPYKQQPSILYPEPSEGAFAEPKVVHGLQTSTSVPQTIAVSETLVSQPHSLAHVPAHMHLLCDILPCPTQSSRAGMSQRNPHNVEDFTKENNISGNLKDSCINDPHRYIPSSPTATSQHTDLVCPSTPLNGGHPSRFREVGSPSMPLERSIPSRLKAGGSPSKTLEGSSPSRLTKIDHSSNCQEEPNLSRHTEEQSQFTHVVGAYHKNPRITNEMAIKETTQTNHLVGSKMERIIRKQKKLTRCTFDGPKITNSAAEKLPKKTKKRQEKCQPERHKDTGDHAPLSSPVQCALGQVVSEVLFPPKDCSPQDAAVPSLHTPPQLLPPSCTDHTSLEVMSQLLRKAEDSDEKEFEDDPLLKVLRTQRKRVKEQISEVDFMLHNMLDK
ncbi:proline and serine-rich protein 3 isoform X2 [Corythoichthys intestinalis]|uniref:proline and serine-rich protein 3 isoform X2 n=1 Tax=Corythoichthys intestinalis TaxID=161448 RepID=UPI0025A604BE|nr:proline and serine-rich protein 3 isoform X2 [Corythoichthys intestinalis]